MLRETRERIVARVKIVRKSLALERASGFAFSYHKTKTSTTTMRSWWPLRSLSFFQPVSHHLLAVRRQHAFRMKLDTMNIIVLMLQTHDTTIIAYCRNVQAVGESRAVYYPRVVSANLYALVQPVENNIVTKLGARGCHSMIHLRKIGKFGTKRLAYGLMTQAYAQYRLATCILADYIHQQSCLRRDARTRTENNLVETLQFRQLELVIAVNRNISSQLLYQMGQIIGKGIVIIYDYYFHFCQCLMLNV